MEKRSKQLVPLSIWCGYNIILIGLNISQDAIFFQHHLLHDSQFNPIYRIQHSIFRKALHTEIHPAQSSAPNHSREYFKSLSEPRVHNPVYQFTLLVVRWVEFKRRSANDRQIKGVKFYRFSRLQLQQLEPANVGTASAHWLAQRTRRVSTSSAGSTLLERVKPRVHEPAPFVVLRSPANLPCLVLLDVAALFKIDGCRLFPVRFRYLLSSSWFKLVQKNNEIWNS